MLTYHHQWLSSEGNFRKKIPQPSLAKIILKIVYSKFHSNLLGANELNVPSCKLSPRPQISLYIKVSYLSAAYAWQTCECFSWILVLIVSCIIYIYIYIHYCINLATQSWPNFYLFLFCLQRQGSRRYLVVSQQPAASRPVRGKESYMRWKLYNRSSICYRNICKWANRLNLTQWPLALLLSNRISVIHGSKIN